ncbi:diacylglycerol/lipid kinase family protein [Terriglobus albidus]|uniref:diacylglycerol/lipid kinase family protein n=1 Tax=Terriglobus albidus TaxID=1592106 RepID=UPI0021E0653D|nr:diacylglycerol kinase family protein [Terriglobus albidus]
MDESIDTGFGVRKRFCVVHNPNAGTRGRLLFRNTVRELQRAGCHIFIVDTTQHERGERIAKDAALSGRFDAIIAAGGDGTLHDVLCGIAGSDIPLGLIPSGTANVFSREIDLPTTPIALAEALMHGPAFNVPISTCNGRPFTFVVGVGFDAAAVQIFEKYRARRFGIFGVVAAALAALLIHNGQAIAIRTAEEEWIAHWVLITRIRRFAGRLKLTPHADIGRSAFQIVSFKQKGKLSLALQLTRMLFAAPPQSRDIRISECHQVFLKGSGSIPVQIDGELIEGLPLQCQFLTRHVPIITGNK